MPVTNIKGRQVGDGSITRADLNIDGIMNGQAATTGVAVIAKLLQGDGIAISSTGFESGTGDVTVNLGNWYTAAPTASLLGRYSSGAGAIQPITLDSSLSLNSTTGVLSVTGFAPASGSANYVQNQYSVSQNAEFSVSGRGRIGGVATFGSDLSLSTSSLVQGGVLDLHAESTNIMIPFLTNDLAYNNLRGGSTTSNIGSSQSNLDALMNGGGDYPINIPVTSIPVEGAIFEINMHKSFAWGNKIGISFGNSNWRARSIKIEWYRDDTQAWATIADVTNWSKPIYQISASTSGYGVSKLRITLNDFNTTYLRVSEIWLLNYQSTLSREVFLGRDGGVIYKGIEPYSDNSMALGVANKDWSTVWTRQVRSSGFLNIRTDLLNFSNGANTTVGTFFASTGNLLLKNGGTHSDSGYRLDVDGTIKQGGTITASSAIARGTYISPTLNASANNDILVGLDISPTFSNGAFTGVSNYGLRVAGNIVPASHLAISGSDIGTTDRQFLRGYINTVYPVNIKSNQGSDIHFVNINSVTIGKIFQYTGNYVLQNGGTFTDAGYRLDVQGTGRFTDNVLLEKYLTIGQSTVNTSTSLYIRQPSIADVSSGNGAHASDVVNILGGNGGSVEATTGFSLGGDSGDIIIRTGNGGNVTGTPTTGFGGSAGDIDITAGDGGSGTHFAGNGGNATLSAGTAGTPIGSAQVGQAGYVAIKGGMAAPLGDGSGGSIYLSPGRGNGSGVHGALFLGVSPSQTIRGNVIIGAVFDEGYLLDVAGTTRITGEVTLSSLNDSTGVAKMVTTTDGVLGYQNIVDSHLGNSDLTLTGSRTVTMGTNSLHFTGDNIRFRLNPNNLYSEWGVSVNNFGFINGDISGDDAVLQLRQNSATPGTYSEILIETGSNSASASFGVSHDGVDNFIEIDSTGYTLTGLNDSTGVPKMLTISNGLLGYTDVPVAPTVAQPANQIVYGTGSGITSSSLLTYDGTKLLVGKSSSTTSYNTEIEGGLYVSLTSSSGMAGGFQKIQNAPNSSDQGDGAYSLSYSLQATSATSQLVTRTFHLGANNNLTGGGSIQNLRVFNLVTSTVLGSSTGDLDAVYIENGTASGTVTNYRSVLLRNYQGTSRAGFVADANAGGTNMTYVLLGTRTIPTGNWSIYSSTSSASYFNGEVRIGSTTDQGAYNLQVSNGAWISGSSVITGSTTASSAVARGLNMTPTLTASANSDTLIGLDINPTFSVGAFTDVNTIGLRIQSGKVFINDLNDSTGVAKMVTVTNGLISYTDVPSSTTIAEPSNQIVYGTGTGVTSDSNLVFNGTNVGLGIGTPTSSGISRYIHIHGTSSSAIRFTNNTTGSTATDGFDISYGSDNHMYFINREAGDIIFYTQASQRGRFTSDGRLLMGFTTSQGNYGIQSNNGIYSERSNSGAIAAVIKNIATGSYGLQVVGGDSAVAASYALQVNDKDSTLLFRVLGNGAQYSAGNISAAAGVARGMYSIQTLTATANSDTLVALDIQPTYSAGAFTEVTNYAIRTKGDIYVGQVSSGLNTTLYLASPSVSIANTGSNQMTLTASSIALNTGVLSSNSNITWNLGNRSISFVTTGTQSFNIIGSRVDTVPLILKTVASQTADLQQWRNSSNVVMSSITADGKFIVGYPSSQGDYNLQVSGASYLEKSSTTAGNNGSTIFAKRTLAGTGTASGYTSAVTAYTSINGGNAAVNGSATTGALNRLYLTNSLYSYTTSNIWSATLSNLQVYNDSTANIISNIRVESNVAWNSTVTQLRDLYIQAPAIANGGAVTTYYGIYQEGTTALNFLSGKLLVGSASSLSNDHNIQTNGGIYNYKQVAGANVPAYGSGNSTGAMNTYIIVGAPTLNYHYGQTNMFQISNANTFSSYRAAGSKNTLYFNNTQYTATGTNYWASLANEVVIVGGSTANKLINTYIQTQVDSTSSITDYYDILIEAAGGSGGESKITNHWGIYQSYPSVKNHFAGKVAIGTTTLGTEQLAVAGTVTATSTLARGVYLNNTLTAAANNDTLVALDINPTFSVGAFTGTSLWTLRVNGPSLFTTSGSTGNNTFSYSNTVSSGIMLWNSTGLYIRGVAGKVLSLGANNSNDKIVINTDGTVNIASLNDNTGVDKVVTVNNGVLSKVTGASGTFTSQDGKTVTVTNGIITSII